MEQDFKILSYKTMLMAQHA